MTDDRTEWQYTVDLSEGVVLMLDGEARVIAANHAARETARALGSDLDTSSSLGDLISYEPFRSAASAVGIEEGLREQVTDPEMGTTWDIAAQKIPSDTDRWVVVARDVTNMVAIESSARRNEVVAEMGNLAGHVAHEVRNPLFSMAATIDALEARLGASEPMLTRHLENIRRDLRRINALMQDLLDYGKPPTLEPVLEPLATAVADAAQALAKDAAERWVTIQNDVQDGTQVLMDQHRLTQAFRNVLDNAVYYSPQHATVTVRAVRHDRGGEPWVDCIVEDQGRGFAPQTLPMVFEPFYTTRHGGTGLGLSIVRRIVELHGGRVEAENRAEGGARVTISLPIRKRG